MSDSARNRIKSQIQTAAVGGQSYTFRKIGALDFANANKQHHGRDANDLAANIEFQVLILSKCLCDSEGLLTSDSDSGRATLAALSVEDLGELCEIVSAWSLPAAGESKKNSVTPSDLHTASVSPAPCDSPPLTNFSLT